MDSVKNKQGFTFIELIIAIFIFSLMMIAVAGIFSSSFGGYRNARIIQKDLEDAQFVMNQMAKTLRTCSIISGSSSEIKVYDYSQNKCIAYRFDPAAKDIKTDASAPVPVDKIPVDWCSTNFSPSFSTADKKMAAFFVKGKFISLSSSNATGSEKLGKITIIMSICSNSGCTGDKANIQSSVSLRDYAKSGI